MSRSPDSKQRRQGFLTAYLALIIVANTVTASVYLWAGAEGVRKSVPGITDGMLSVLVAAALANAVCAGALLWWRKWGFWGFAGSSVALFAVNVFNVGFAVPTVWLGLLAVVLLYLLLRAGGKDAAWPKLR